MSDVNAKEAARASISRLTDDELHALTKYAYFWGMHPAGIYEMRYAYTQLKSSPTYVGDGRVRWDRNLRTARDRDITTPNATTLYGFGFFDLRREPVVVTTPAIPDRYFSVQACDQYPRWYFMVGNQFTGREAQQRLIVGPDFTGPFPTGFPAAAITQAPSNVALVATRIAIRNNTPEELETVRALMDEFTIVPLGRWIDGGRKPIAAKDQPAIEPDYAAIPRMAQLVDIATSLTAIDLLQLVSLVLNDPTMTRRTDSAKELATLSRLEALGLRPGVRFDPAWLTEAQQQVADAAFAEAKQESARHVQGAFVTVNGWGMASEFSPDLNDYVAQGFFGLTTLGAPIPMMSHAGAFAFTDIEGHPFNGASQYTLTFDMDDLPPVTEFWELPLYDEHGYFVDNPIDRYSLNSFMLERGDLHVENGKLIIPIQHDEPTDPHLRRNWLPAPEGAFRFAFRYYGPMNGLLDRTYDMPGIVRTT